MKRSAAKHKAKRARDARKENFSFADLARAEKHPQSPQSQRVLKAYDAVDLKTGKSPREMFVETLVQLHEPAGFIVGILDFLKTGRRNSWPDLQRAVFERIAKDIITDAPVVVRSPSEVEMLAASNRSRAEKSKARKFLRDRMREVLSYWHDCLHFNRTGPTPKPIEKLKLFVVNTEVEGAVPICKAMFDVLKGRHRNPNSAKLTLEEKGFSDDKMREAVAYARTRSPIEAARTFVALKYNLDRETVAKYHREFQKIAKTRTQF